MKAVGRAVVLISLAAAFAHGAFAQPAVTSVLNGASLDAVLSPGCWIAIFGSDLAAGPATAPPDSLPMSLGGVSVTVGGLAAPLLYVSPTQVNALIPFETAIPTNTVVPVAITSPDGNVTYNVRLTRNAPAIFTRNGLGTGRALLFDGSSIELDIVNPGDTVLFYATGLGPVEASGLPADDFKVYLGEREARVVSAGAVPGYPGLFQIKAIAPAMATDRLYIRSGNWQSNIVDVGIRAGANTANVNGVIDGLYPSNDPMFTLPTCMGDDIEGPPCGPGESFSVMMHAGTFSVSFDILPSAGPFDVAAVGEAGGALISIDAGAGKYTASVMEPTAAARFGDFRDSIVPLWDFAQCNLTTAVCGAFPGPSVIPAARIPPLWVRAVQALPASNAAGTPPNAFLQTSGPLSGSHFVIDDQNNTTLSKFGGMIQVPFGPFEKRVSTFKLYVDGKLVASKEFPYTVMHR